LVEKNNVKMLQFDRSLNTNSNAVWPNVTASVGTTLLLLDFTQSYDSSTTLNVQATLLNTVSPSNEWLVFQLTGSSVPTASGQYNVDIYSATQGTTLGTWQAQATLWNTTANTWNGGGGIVKGALLSTERAYVSGSNEYTITQYLSPTSSRYYTYNHP
jgi:hypothetical protein